MSVAEIKRLRDEINKYLDHADERVLRMVHAMLQADAEDKDTLPFYLTSELEAILDERMEKYEKGEMKFSTWDDAKARMITHRRNKR